MEAQDAGFLTGLKVTVNGIPDGQSKIFEGVGLRKHRGPQGAGSESAFGSLFDPKHQLIHGAMIPRGLGAMLVVWSRGCSGLAHDRHPCSVTVPRKGGRRANSSITSSMG